jgi:hypothetical protein
MPKAKDQDDKFSPEETERRVEAAIRGARIAGHKSQDEMKIGKSPKKPTKRPNKRR